MNSDGTTSDYDRKRLSWIFFVSMTALALIAVLLGFVLTSHTSMEPDGCYDYEYEYSYYFIDKQGETQVPLLGHVFVIMDITLQNDCYDDGISTSLDKLIWRLVVDGEKSNPNPLTLEHPYYKDVTLGCNEKITFTVVFEILDSENEREIHLGYDYITKEYKPVLKYKKGLATVENDGSITAARRL